VSLADESEGVDVYDLETCARFRGMYLGGGECVSDSSSVCEECSSSGGVSFCGVSSTGSGAGFECMTTGSGSGGSKGTKVMLNFLIGGGGAVTGAGAGALNSSFTGSSGTNEKFAVRLGVDGDEDAGEVAGDEDVDESREGGGVKIHIGKGADIGGFIGSAGAAALLGCGGGLVVKGVLDWEVSLDGGRRGSN